MNTPKQTLKNGRLLFDGAMGTYFSSRPGCADLLCEQANLSQPATISAIHREYLEAGARCIKTNTFSLGNLITSGMEAEAFAVIDAACGLAQQAAAPFDAHVFADLGPAPMEADAGKLYCTLADRFLQNGITCFLAETLADDEGIAALALHLKQACPDSFLLVSFAASPEGITAAGHAVLPLLRRVNALPEVDAVGLNCMSGPNHMAALLRSLPLAEFKAFSVMPNAGYPAVLGRRTVFNGQPDYFAQQLQQIAALGVNILGGCCGTTPAHIAAAVKALSAVSLQPLSPAAPAEDSKGRPQRNPLWEKLEAGKRILAVELDPPADDRIDPFLEGVKTLQKAGADLITIADCPIGRPRADSSLLACKVKRELGIEPLPHMTCRDRNMFATKALLLGLSIEGVHNVLLVTGDPIPTAQRDEVKSVFNFNSRKLAAYVTMLNETTFQTPFRLFGALNVNAVNFGMQLKLAQQKEENGISGFLTQPVLSPMAVENLKLARRTLKGKILGGIYPVVSHKNAVFMNNEVTGVHVSDEIIARYEGKNREEAEELAVEISVQIAKEIAPYTDGFYFMTPFQRTGLIARILEQLPSDGSF